MADAKLTALTAASALAAADLFYVSQSAASRKATGTQLLALVGTAYVPLAGGTMTGALKIADGTKSAPSLSYNSEATVGLYYRTPGYLSFAVNNKAVAEVTESSLNISTIGFAAAESNDFSTAWISTYFGTEGAGFLRMRGVVGTNPQAFRIYGTADGSPGSNYQRMVLSANGTTGVTIAAEGLGTPGANQNITLKAGGTGSITFNLNGSDSAYFDYIGNLVLKALYSTSLYLPSTALSGWTSGSLGASIDIALMRNAAGVVEVTNGTANTYRDLKLRNLLSTGYATIDSGTLTASAPALSITQTWNQGATAFTGALIDITNTASSDPSRALDVRIAGSSIFSVRPDGYAISSTGLFVGSGGTNGLWDSVGPHVKSTGAYSWAQSENATETSDLFLYRDAAASLALRNGTAQQSFSVYNTYTDSSNYERLKLTGVAGTSVNITAETLGTGGDNLDIVLTPAGTGNVKFGTHSAIAAETVTGYITIKDAGGTTRKLAVVS